MTKWSYSEISFKISTRITTDLESEVTQEEQVRKIKNQYSRANRYWATTYFKVLIISQRSKVTKEDRLCHQASQWYSSIKKLMEHTAQGRHLWFKRTTQSTKTQMRLHLAQLRRSRHIRPLVITQGKTMEQEGKALRLYRICCPEKANLNTVWILVKYPEQITKHHWTIQKWTCLKTLKTIAKYVKPSNMIQKEYAHINHWKMIERKLNQFWTHLSQLVQAKERTLCLEHQDCQVDHPTRSKNKRSLISISSRF